MYLDATHCKARVDHQIVSRAVVIATGITVDCGREALELMAGDFADREARPRVRRRQPTSHPLSGRPDWKGAHETSEARKKREPLRERTYDAEAELRRKTEIEATKRFLDSEERTGRHPR